MRTAYTVIDYEEYIEQGSVFLWKPRVVSPTMVATNACSLSEPSEQVILQRQQK
jgi:hypothetical protein